MSEDPAPYNKPSDNPFSPVLKCEKCGAPMKYLDIRCTKCGMFVSYYHVKCTLCEHEFDYRDSCGY